MFTITGPGSPSVLLNMPVAIEQHVDWIADCLEYMREHGWTRIEATESAQDAWAEHVAEVGQESLYLARELVVRRREHPRQATRGVALHGRATHVPRPLRRDQGFRIRGLRVRSLDRAADTRPSTRGRGRTPGVRSAVVVKLGDGPAV